MPKSAKSALQLWGAKSALWVQKNYSWLSPGLPWPSSLSLSLAFVLAHEKQFLPSNFNWPKYHSRHVHWCKKTIHGFHQASLGREVSALALPLCRHTKSNFPQSHKIWLVTGIATKYHSSLSLVIQLDSCLKKVHSPASKVRTVKCQAVLAQV